MSSRERSWHCTRASARRASCKGHLSVRDIRAEAAVDAGVLAHSQKLLAHKNRDMKEH